VNPRSSPRRFWRSRGRIAVLSTLICASGPLRTPHGEESCHERCLHIVLHVQVGLQLLLEPQVAMPGSLVCLHSVDWAAVFLMPVQASGLLMRAACNVTGKQPEHPNCCS
jgi:hypothetical protein